MVWMTVEPFSNLRNDNHSQFHSYYECTNYFHLMNVWWSSYRLRCININIYGIRNKPRKKKGLNHFWCFKSPFFIHAIMQKHIFLCRRDGQKNYAISYSIFDLDPIQDYMSNICDNIFQFNWNHNRHGYSHPIPL